MEMTRPVIQKTLRVLKALLAAYALTAVCLLILAILLLKLSLNEANVNLGILITYILSCFLGGFILGKTMGRRKFLWGLGLGAVYFLIAFLISLLAFPGAFAGATHLITMLLICAGAGTAGGMLS